MFGTKLGVVRIIVFLLIIVATYAVGLYLFERYVQLNDEQVTQQVEEVNNPRLNHKMLEKIDENYKSRKIYSPEDTIDVQIPESSPFSN